MSDLTCARSALGSISNWPINVATKSHQQQKIFVHIRDKLAASQHKLILVSRQSASSINSSSRTYRL